MQRTSKAISGVAHAKSTSEKDGFRPDIEGLRGIAVALVVLFHAGLLSHNSAQLTGGFIGVDLFFVVSGYLITGLLIRERERTGRVSFSRFYARRVRRILPAAAVVLLVTIPLSSQLVTLVQRPSVMQDGASAALSVANIRFAMTTDYFNPVNYSPFLHFWSLGVEEQFYFVWPALLALVAWKRPRLGAAAALSAVVVASFAASIVITDESPSTAFYLLPTRAWQLAAGGLLAIGAGSLDRAPAAIRSAVGMFLVFAGWAALAALLTAAVVIDTTTTAIPGAAGAGLTPYPGMAALVPTVAGVLLIASGTQPMSPGFLLRLAPIRFLGKISYSLYLWHWPILILGGIWLVGPLDTISLEQAVGLAALAIPVAALSWFFVEEPFRRGQIPLPRPSRVVAVGVAVMLAVALIGASLDFGAQSALANIGGGPADPTATLEATATPTASPTPYVIPPTLAPSQTPTPKPEMTPALTPAPDQGPPTTYAITSAIRPALGKAAEDKEQPWRDQCLGWERTTTPNTSSKCIYGDPSGTYTVAMIGDSHGSALFPGVNEVAKAHGWKLIPYLKIDCSFVDIKTINFNTKQEYTACETWNNVVLGKLNASPPDLAIISQSRWIFALDDRDATVTAQANALTRMIQKLPPSTRVVIVEDPPLPTNVDVPVCLSTYLSDYRRCSYTQKLGFGSSMRAREERAAEATGAALIDLTSAICPGTGNCPVVIDNMIVWRDAHHLTRTFATSLGPVIDEQLTAILNQWAKEAPSSAPPS